MVQKTLATKSMDDMVVDALRKDIRSGLNSILENGALSDIEFKEFRIDKVE
jgi:flagellar basal body-associated protein FliL